MKRPDGSDWELGSGGFGKVFKALRNGVQPVAVKVLLVGVLRLSQQSPKHGLLLGMFMYQCGRPGLSASLHSSSMPTHNMSTAEGHDFNLVHSGALGLRCQPASSDMQRGAWHAETSEHDMRHWAAPPSCAYCRAALCCSLLQASNDARQAAATACMYVPEHKCPGAVLRMA
jgi:hypothetical protein